MDLLVTGACGRIGSLFVDAVTHGSRFRVLRSDVHDDRPEHPTSFHALDVTDAAACRDACRGMEAVLHLAADPSQDAEFRSTVLPVNMIGTYNMVEAALATGVRRFVFASSAQVVEGYPLDYQPRESDPPRPSNDYGVGKAFGEAVCAAAAEPRDAGSGPRSFVSVRIGNFQEDRPGPGVTLRDRMAWLSPRDMVQLLSLALTVPLEGHHVVDGVSNNRVKRLSLTHTSELLGYRPEDDAFAAPSGEDAFAPRPDTGSLAR